MSFSPTGIYSVSDYYWIVNGSTTQVYSSARAIYVPVTDATYVAWLATGATPTLIDSEASLQDVFAAHYPAGWPPTLSQQVSAALNGTFSIISTTLGLAASDAYPNGIPFKVNDTTQSHINSELNAIALSQSNRVFADGTTAINWPDTTTNTSPANLHTWSVSQFIYFATLVGTYVSAIYKVESGSLTTLPAPYFSDVPASPPPPPAADTTTTATPSVVDTTTPSTSTSAGPTATTGQDTSTITTSTAASETTAAPATSTDTPATTDTTVSVTVATP